MNLANKLTLLRVILAPVFLIIYLSHKFFLNSDAPAEFVFWTVPVLWCVFIISEITDYFDGLAARKLNLTSGFGKLFDPFADTLMQVTCFFCFVIDGIWGDNIIPILLFILLVYREFGILFVRNLMLKKGVTLGARTGGKIKTVAYIIAIGAALLAVSCERLGIFESLQPYLKTGSLVIFAISVILAVISFFDYLYVYNKTEKAAEIN